MKKLFTLGFLLLCSYASQAQWTMNFADFPLIGDSQYYTLTDTTGVVAGASGTGVNWDFSGLTPKTTHRTSTMVLPSSIPSGASCPSANISYSDNAGYYYHYQTAGTDSVVLWGERSLSASVIPYTNPPKVREFPFNISDSYTDSVNAVYFDGIFSNATREGTITVTYDASGTLITPFASYSDVLRVHTAWVTFDSSWSGLVDTYGWIDLYEWYQNGKTLPVFSLRNQYLIVNGSSPQITKEVMFADSMVVATDEALVAHDGLTLYPNPAAEQVSLDFDATSVMPASAQIFDLTGRVVISQALGTTKTGLNTLQLDISGLTTGAYIVIVKCGDQTLRSRLIVE